MNQAWIVGLALSLALGMSAGAVDVKQKDTTKVLKPKTKQTPAKKPVTPPAQPPKSVGQPAGKGGKVQPTQKKYDDFIDNNHNGIDDRKENLVKKEDK